MKFSPPLLYVLKKDTKDDVHHVTNSEVSSMLLETVLFNISFLKTFIFFINLYSLLPLN